MSFFFSAINPRMAVTPTEPLAPTIQNPIRRFGIHKLIQEKVKKQSFGLSLGDQKDYFDRTFDFDYSRGKLRAEEAAQRVGLDVRVNYCATKFRAGQCCQRQESWSQAQVPQMCGLGPATKSMGR
jgi:hypothetical protein